MLFFCAVGWWDVSVKFVCHKVIVPTFYVIEIILKDFKTLKLRIDIEIK